MEPTQKETIGIVLLYVGLGFVILSPLLLMFPLMSQSYVFPAIMIMGMFMLLSGLFLFESKR